MVPKGKTSGDRSQHEHGVLLGLPVLKAPSHHLEKFQAKGRCGMEEHGQWTWWAWVGGWT